VCAPTLFHRRSDTPWLAFALFEAIQFGSYSLFALFHVLLQPLLSRIPYDAWLAFISVPLVYLLLFVLLREVVILSLWETITVRLNANIRERDVLMRSVN